MRSVLVALLVTIGITSAQADIIYNVSFGQYSVGAALHSEVTGTIITDGAIGVITPANIVGMHMTDVDTDIYGSFRGTYTVNVPMASWTDGSVTATASTISFDFEPQFLDTFPSYAVPQFTASVSIGMISFIPAFCGIFNACGDRYIGSTRLFEDREFIVLAGGGIEAPAEAVPGPILGAGLPGLMLAGLLGWWRRKRRPNAP